MTTIKKLWKKILGYISARFAGVFRKNRDDVTEDHVHKDNGNEVRDKDVKSKDGIQTFNIVRCKVVRIKEKQQI